MPQIFVVYTDDGVQIAQEITTALRKRRRRLGIESFTPTMRGDNARGNAQLRQVIKSSAMTVVLLTPSALNSRTVERAVDTSEQEDITVFPIQIDGTSLPSPRMDNWQGFPITSGNPIDIERVVAEILNDIYPAFGWWRKLPLSGKALLSGFGLFLGLLFAFFALFSDEDRRIFFCNFTSNALPSCQITITALPLETEVGVIISSTPKPTDILVPTDILIASNTPESPTPTSMPTDTPEAPTPTPTPPPIQCEQLLFAENFDDGFPANWVADAGKWAIGSDNGNPVFQMIGEGIKTIQLGDTIWNNYALEFEVKPTYLNANDTVIVDLRMSPKFNNRITFLLDFASKVVYLYELSALDIGVPRRLALKTYSFSENSWLKVRIELKDQQVRLYLNGDSRISFDEIDPTIYQGIIQLQSSSPLVLFDNISVSSLEDCPT